MIVRQTLEVGSSVRSRSSLWLMVGLSGFACLIYQILWMRQVGLLFGNTSQAAALTLAVFFGGLSLGGWYFGRRSRTHSSPLRTYAWLEIGIAFSGIAILMGPLVVPPVYRILSDEEGGGLVLNAFRLAWTMLMVFPAAFFMGGTVPIAGQAGIRASKTFGQATARLYAVNTIGAAIGAFVAAFVLLGLVGVRMTCLVAMAISLVAAWLSWSQGSVVASLHRPSEPKARRAAAAQPSSVLPRPVLAGLSFLSGFNLLAMEVLWTRMLALVHENSVYSFAAVLIVVLVCLALGAWLASWLAGGRASAPAVLAWLLIAGGVALALTPLLFVGLTHGVRMLDTDYSFATYVLRLFLTAAISMGPACLLLGTVFPFLMKCEEPFVTHAGESIGLLAAGNSIGAILGSLVAGFVLLEWLGVWGSVQLVAIAYLLAAFLLASTLIPRIATGVVILLVFTVLSPTRVPAPGSFDAKGNREAVLATWEGSDCTVTVTRNIQDDLSIKINSNYSLGSTAAFGPQIYQARVPLLAYPATESVFFLGMGTGITAGEALDREDFKRIERVVACEISANVVEASKTYFSGSPGAFDPTNGLYRDPRARVIVADGRNHLLVNRDRYQMVIADLFLPYLRGAGSLYTREHFEVVRERLEPGGVFFQWLPLYQITEKEFGTIARTMLEVFPQVTLWRGNFQPGAEIAALVGHRDPLPLTGSSQDVEDSKRQAVEGATFHDINRLMLPINEETVLLFYGGNISRAADLFDGYPLNTDDHPVIEFETPRSLHRPSTSEKPHFLEKRFADFVDTIQKITPPASDPVLRTRTASSRFLPLAGSAFHRAWIASAYGDESAQMKQWEKFVGLWLK